MVKTPRENTNIACMEGSISIPCALTSEGWMVRHHRMDMNTIGTSTQPTMPTTASKRARRCPSGKEDLTMRYATQINHRTRVVVRRGSHVQYAPQMGLAHSGPVTRVMVVKTTPISAEATAIRSYSNSFFHRYRIPQINTTVKAGPRANHALGM